MPTTPAPGVWGLEKSNPSLSDRRGTLHGFWKRKARKVYGNAGPRAPRLPPPGTCLPSLFGHFSPDSSLSDQPGTFWGGGRGAVVPRPLPLPRPPGTAGCQAGRTPPLSKRPCISLSSPLKSHLLSKALSGHFIKSRHFKPGIRGSFSELSGQGQENKSDNCTVPSLWLQSNSSLKHDRRQQTTEVVQKFP